MSRNARPHGSPTSIRIEELESRYLLSSSSGSTHSTEAAPLDQPSISDDSQTSLVALNEAHQENREGGEGNGNHGHSNGTRSRANGERRERENDDNDHDHGDDDDHNN